VINDIRESVGENPKPDSNNPVWEAQSGLLTTVKALHPFVTTKSMAAAINFEPIKSSV
jgi:hypothetical protein